MQKTCNPKSSILDSRLRRERRAVYPIEERGMTSARPSKEKRGLFVEGGGRWMLGRAETRPGLRALSWMAAAQEETDVESRKGNLTLKCQSRGKFNAPSENKTMGTIGLFLRPGERQTGNARGVSRKVPCLDKEKRGRNNFEGVTKGSTRCQAKGSEFS